MSITSLMPSNHLILSFPSPPTFNLSQHQGLFQWPFGLCIRWPKYWSFSFSISPPNEYSALISFRIDWLDLLAVQGTLKRLLQHHSSKASIFFSAQPSLWSNSHIHRLAWYQRPCSCCYMGELFCIQKIPYPPTYEGQASGCFLGNPRVRACTGKDVKAHVRGESATRAT